MPEKRSLPTIDQYPQWFSGFVGFYLQSHCTAPFSSMHRDFCSAIRYQQVAIAAPRGSAKSYFLSFFYPLFLAITEPGIFIVLCSATHTLSTGLLRRIKRELEGNEALRTEFGPQMTDKWSEEHIILANGTEIVSRSVTSQVRGLRGPRTVVMLDDAEDDAAVQSPEGRDKFRDFVEKEILPIKQSDQSQVLLIGTILHEESYLRQCILGRKPAWHAKAFQALLPDGQSVWPAIWPARKLKEWQQDNPDAFAQEYQNDPIPDGKRLFQQAWFQSVPRALVPHEVLRFLTVDPAIAQSRTADDTAICQVAVDSDGRWYVEAVLAGQFTPQETIQTILSRCKQFPIQAVGLETIGFQKTLQYMLREESLKQHVFPRVIEVNTTRTKKLWRIQALQPYFQQGRIAFVEGAAGIEKLTHQLLGFPTARHDDCPDSLAQMCEIYRPAQKVTGPPPHPNSWEATARRIEQRSHHPGVWGNHQIPGDYH